MKKKTILVIGAGSPYLANRILEARVMIPITKGCPNEVCNCTGDCQKIIGYRNKHPLEK